MSRRALLLSLLLAGCPGPAAVVPPDAGGALDVGHSADGSSGAPDAAQDAGGAGDASAPVGLITDDRLIPIPASGTYPARCAALVDPATGMAVMRFADKADLTGDYAGHQSDLSAIVYSRYSPVNSSGEFVLVHGDNSTSAWVFRVNDCSVATILRFEPGTGAASRALGEINELRWDYSGLHPYRVYFVGRALGGTGPSGEKVGMSFYSTEFDPGTGAQAAPTLVHDFSVDFPAWADAEIMNDVEGDSSIDSRYWAWQVMDTSLGDGYRPFAVFTYDKQADKVLGSLQRSCAGALAPCVAASTPATAAPHLSRPNMVEMSPLGTRVVVDWGRVYDGNRDADLGTVADGPKGFLPDFSDPIRIGADETHSGWAWGPGGEEMFVSQNNRNDWIEAVDVKDATTAACAAIDGNSYSCGVKVLPYALLDGGSWSLGMHFGKLYDPAQRGWLYMSTYDASYASWGKNQNLLVEINDHSARPSKVVRLGSTYNLYYDYRSEGSGALDTKATSVWATGNWGFSDGRGDVFRVELPAGWYGLLP